MCFTYGSAAKRFQSISTSNYPRKYSMKLAQRSNCAKESFAAISAGFVDLVWLFYICDLAMIERPSEVGLELWLCFGS